MSATRKKIAELIREDTGSNHMNSKTNDQISKNENSIIVKKEEKNEAKTIIKTKNIKNNEVMVSKEVNTDKIKRKNTEIDYDGKKDTKDEVIIAEEVLEIQKVNTPENITMPRCKRLLMFIFVVALNISINLDHGIIPASTTELENDLHITPTELGIFGSLLYAGNAVGSIITMAVIDKFNRKISIFICIILIGLGLWSFTMTKNLAFLFINRFMVGIFQAFITVFCPVWVDQFGPRNKRTVMMSLLMIGPPLGIVLGYAMTMFIIRAGISWKYSFTIQAGVFVLFPIGILFLPSIYFSSTLKCINLPNLFLEHVEQEEKKMRAKTMTEEEIKNEVKDKKHDASDVISLFQHSIEKEDKIKNFWRDLCILIKMKVYMICVCAISVLLFISTAIQFWTTNYLQEVLKIDNTIIFIAFVATCITAPTLGIIVGGCIVQKLGGYEGRKSLYICSIYALFALISGVPIVFFDGIIGFAVFLWLFLFFGGCIVPNLMGIILSSLPENMRAAGNSVTLFFTTAIGFLPAPSVYGVIYEATSDSLPNLAYGIVINYSVVSFVLIIIGAVVREGQFKQRIQEHRLSIKVLKKECKLKINKSENENLRDNSEIKIDSTDSYINKYDDSSLENNDRKDISKFSDYDEIEIKMDSSNIIKEDIVKKSGSERKVINGSDKIFKERARNEEAFDVKIRNSPIIKKNLKQSKKVHR